MEVLKFYSSKCCCCCHVIWIDNAGKSPINLPIHIFLPCQSIHEYYSRNSLTVVMNGTKHWLVLLIVFFTTIAVVLYINTSFVCHHTLHNNIFVYSNILFWVFETTNVYVMLVGILGGKWLLVMPRCDWKDNIEMDLKEILCQDMKSIHLTQDTVQW